MQLLSAFIGLFEGLMTKVKEVGIKTALTSLFIIVVLCSLFIIMDKVQVLSDKNPSPEQEHKTFEAAITANRQIQIRLDDTRSKLAASRTVVYQFHNGQTDMAGLPFTKTTVTYASIKKGVEFDQIRFQPQPLSVWSEALDTMWRDFKNPVCTKLVYSDVKSEQLKERMNGAGVEVLYACPMINITGGPVGMVTAGYLDKNTIRPDDEVILAELHDVAERTAGYLIAARDAAHEKNWMDKIKIWE